MTMHRWSIALTWYLASFCIWIAATHAGAAPLPDNALIMTHTTGYYHTDSETAVATQNLVMTFRNADLPIIALYQTPIISDPQWYGARPDEVTMGFYSRHGEHPLIPADSFHFSVTVAGGYHSACLGWTLAELIANFHDTRATGTLTIQLPLAAIFSGFLRDHSGDLNPPTPQQEAILDDSVDGLNYDQVTRTMPDVRFSSFMKSTLQVGTLSDAPLRSRNLSNAGFSLWRNDQLLLRFNVTGDTTTGAEPMQIQFRYN